MNLDKLEPKYYFCSSDIDVHLLLRCGLCRQAATDSLASSVCYVQYCQRYLITMINARSMKKGKAEVEMTGSPFDLSFYCTNNCKNAKALYYIQLKD